MFNLLRVFVSLLLITNLVSSCASQPSGRPPYIDLLHRHTVHTTMVDSRTLAYLDEGQGPPVILIHGFGGSMWQWEHQQEALARRYRVITIDMLGSGLSDKPEIDYSPAFLLNSFTEFMDSLGIQQATLIGNSMGAGVAMGMALTHPDRVAKLVLVSGFPAKVRESIASPSYKGFVNTPPPIWLARLGMWVAGRWTTKRILTEIIHDPQQITPLIIERSYQNRQDPRFLHPLYSQINHLQEWEEHFAPRLEEITHPTLIIWGEKDGVFPPTVGRDIHRIIPHSAFLEVPDSGHIPQWENPQVVNPAILEFLSSQ